MKTFAVGMTIRQGYKIIAVIGAGGVGTVFLAHDYQSNK